jgi:hypothetical protein
MQAVQAAAASHRRPVRADGRIDGGGALAEDGCSGVIAQQTRSDSGISSTDILPPRAVVAAIELILRNARGAVPWRDAAGASTPIVRAPVIRAAGGW